MDSATEWKEELNGGGKKCGNGFENMEGEV
jgi:hypothetical protein